MSDELQATDVDTPETAQSNEIDKLADLEERSTTKLLFDTNRTAYICKDSDGTSTYCHSFNVYNTDTKTHTKYGLLATNFVYQDPRPLSDISGRILGHDTGVHNCYSLKEVLEIYPDTFIVAVSNNVNFLVTKASLERLAKPSYDTLRVQALKHAYSMRINGLSQVRAKGGFDFELVTGGGGEDHVTSSTIPVHSLILRSNWPFFDAMMDSQMSESRDNRMEMPYPHSWVEALVSYFYGEPFDVEFSDATRLLILSDVYDIPELQRLAITRIRAEDLDMHKCLAGWKNAFEAQNAAMRSYFATFARKNWKTLEESTEFLQKFTQQQAVELMLDVSRACVDGLAL